MSQHPPGLTSALHPGSDDKPSAVASIASRFNAPAASSDAPKKLGDKVSDLATRFGTTIDPTTPNPLTNPSKTSLSRQRNRAAAAALNADNSAQHDLRVVSEAPPSVNDVAKRFLKSSSSSSSSQNPSASRPDSADDSAAGFASAHDRFRRAEEAERRPAESRVSAFAKRIESGANIPADIDVPDNKVAGVARTFESKDTERLPVPDLSVSSAPTAVGSVRSKFESAASSSASLSNGSLQLKPEDDQPLESAGNRFASAAKLFQSGNPPSSKPDSSDPDDAQTAQSRFADAARMFGGS